MLHRDWILSALEKLPLWYWPIFFFEIWTFERYYRAYRAANPVGMIGIGVTQTGRIIITLQGAGERPDPGHWTTHAPRAPWRALDLGRLAAAFAADPKMYRNWAVTGLALGPASAPAFAPADPVFLDPG